MRKMVLVLLLVLIFCSPCFGFELMVLGDSRSGMGNEDYQKTEEIINDAVAYTESNYSELVGIVMTGDYVNRGRDEEEWEEWIEANEKAFAYPIYPCIGNHDDEDGDYAGWNYYHTFSALRWWSVDIGELHLVSLDATLNDFDVFFLYEYVLEMMQYFWCEDDLKAHQDKPTIVIWHSPAYGSYTWFLKGHGSDSFMRERYVPLCEQYGVEMVMCGHNHWYERATVNGIRHITTGGAGAPLLPVSPLPTDKVEGSQVNISAYHWCVVSVGEGMVRVDAIEHATHKVLDSFEIEF